MSGEPASPAEAYQDYYGPAIFEPLSERVLAVHSPTAGQRVLDVASGTGILTRRLASAVGPAGGVVAVDLNPAMVALAERLGGEGAEIDYRVGDGTSLDLPDSSFDVAYCQQGMQFFPDREAGAREMQRVLADGGRAVVVTWCGIDAHPLFAALADAEEPQLAANGLDVGRDELVAPFSLGDGDELVSLLRGAGFGEVELHRLSIDARFPDADRFVERMEFAYAAVVPAFAADPEAFAGYLTAIAEATEEVVAKYRHGGDVVVPMHANLAVASVS